jgi:hypothetical protein
MAKVKLFLFFANYALLHEDAGERMYRATTSLPMDYLEDIFRFTLRPLYNRDENPIAGVYEAGRVIKARMDNVRMGNFLYMGKNV